MEKKEKRPPEVAHGIIESLDGKNFQLHEGFSGCILAAASLIQQGGKLPQVSRDPMLDILVATIFAQGPEAIVQLLASIMYVMNAKIEHLDEQTAKAKAAMYN